MRLLHTSDWHLGRTLHRADLRDAQAAFLDHLVDTVRAERVDAVLVSGDVYDRALPPVEAVALCEEALCRLRDAGARVVVISGNHDSARRLGFGSRLVDASGVHLRTRVAAVAEPVVLHDAHGEVSVYAIPYLEPAVAGPELAAPQADPPARSHADVLRTATGLVRADAARRTNRRSVVLAHGWVTGGQTCDSERDISVGGTGAVPAALFAGFDYVALGHLHRPQVIAGHLRYSGSPLAYSFSEAGQVKGSWLVELGAAGLGRVEHVPVPAGRRLTRLRGPLAELLTDPRHAGAEDDYVAAVLTDPDRPSSAMDRLRTRFPHLLLLSHEPAAGPEDSRDYRARVVGRSDLGVAADFVCHVRGTAASEAELRWLRRAFEAVRVAEGADGPPPEVEPDVEVGSKVGSKAGMEPDVEHAEARGGIEHEDDDASGELTLFGVGAA